MTHPTDDELLKRLLARVPDPTRAYKSDATIARNPDGEAAAARIAELEAMLRACKTGDARMTDPDLTAPEAVERLAQRLDGAQCASGCGTMAFCVCAYAADCVDTLRALSAALEAEKRKTQFILKERDETFRLMLTRAEAAEAERDEADALIAATFADAAENNIRLAELSHRATELEGLLREARAALRDMGVDT